MTECLYRVWICYFDGIVLLVVFVFSFWLLLFSINPIENDVLFCSVVRKGSRRMAKIGTSTTTKMNDNKTYELVVFGIWYLVWRISYFEHVQSIRKWKLQLACLGLLSFLFFLVFGFVGDGCIFYISWCNCMWKRMLERM